MRNNLFPKNKSDPLSEIVREQRCWRARGLGGPLLRGEAGLRETMEVVAALLRADVVLTDDLRWSMALRAARRRDGGLGGAEDAASEGDHDCQHCARD